MKLTDQFEPKIAANRCLCGSLRQGRHCLACGHSVPEHKEPKLHVAVEPEDGQPLVDVLREHGLTLPKDAIAWRVKSVVGNIPTLDLQCRLILTNGVVAWFILGNGTPFFGHLDNFKPDKVEGAGYKGPRKAKAPREKSKRQLLLESI